MKTLGPAKLKISLFGIGYVGSVSAACLARDGHEVLAVDTNPDKVSALNRGCAPIFEPGLESMIEAAVAQGRLRGIGSAEDAVAQTDVSIICVGTPSAPDRSLDLSAVERVTTVIGQALARKASFHTVVVRSTLPPGAMTGRILPLIEQASGLQAGVGFGLAYYPEFLREGAAIRDYDDPSQAVFAATDALTSARVLALHPKTALALTAFGFGEAEAIKMGGNLLHGLKVSFANEFGGVLGALGIDSHGVMEAICQDRRLNISPAYLKPGFAFGGSCLPKDVKAFTALGQAAGRETPLLEATLQVNEHLIAHAVRLVEAAGGRRVAIIGLAFKPGTDDLRESPYLALAERLIGAGLDVRVFDPVVRVERLIGANLAYVSQRLPLPSLLCDTIEVAVEHAQTLVLAHADIGAAALDLANDGQTVIDLVRVRPELRTGGHYVGLSW